MQTYPVINQITIAQSTMHKRANKGGYKDKPIHKRKPPTHSRPKPQEKTDSHHRPLHAQHNLNASNQDDFFLLDEEEHKRAEHQAVAEQLQQQYYRKQHRLYEDLTDTVSLFSYKEPIQYKGHTLCITAFQLTPTHIYSCSKDKSIIQWDRQTHKKQFLSLGKDPQSHKSDILSLALHSNHNILATAADDCQIKLWDTRTCKLIDTLRGHKNTVNGVKFGVDSNNLCSVSADLTLKHWDVAQRGLIGTYYEHTAELLDVDYFNGEDFISSGYDKQVIAWKTEKETKVVYKGHHYAIDRVRTINQERFLTACQDGSIHIWNTKKTKAVFKVPDAHPSGWISAMDNIKQSNILATAGVDHVVKIWGIENDHLGLKEIAALPVKGIVTDLKLSLEELAVTECDELRLGRWITEKCRNKIKIFPVEKKAIQQGA